jgi:hypothetical protein
VTTTELKYKEFFEQTKNEEQATHLWLQWRCMTDLFFLGYEILGLREAKDRNTGRKLVDTHFHGWLCQVLSTSEDVMVIVPRRHMKTTWVKIKLIQNILKNPFVRQAMYSSTSSLVEQELASIKKMLQTPRLMALFPSLIPDPGKKGTGWEVNRASELTLYRNPEEGSSPQECQIEVYGAGSTVTGKHFDIHIYDDLISEKTTQTMEQVNKTREWYGYIQGVLEPGGQEIYIGTPYHYADLTTFIRNEGIYDKIYKRSVTENGQIIYSYFTQKMLDKIQKRMTPYQWSCQYVCDPQPQEDQLFPPPQPQFDELPKGKYTYYISVDPAATVKTWSDETAIVVGAVSEIGHVFIVDAFHFKKTGDKTAEFILQLNERYKPRKIGIEFRLQEHLRYVIELTKSNWEASQRTQIFLPIEGIDISNKSKYDRINLTLGSFIRSNRMAIKSNLTDLMTQMQLYNRNYSGKDDLVDACSMLFSVIDTFSFKYWSQPLGLVRKGMMTLETIFKKKTAVGWEDRFSK